MKLIEWRLMTPAEKMDYDLTLHENWEGLFVNLWFVQIMLVGRAPKGIEV